MLRLTVTLMPYLSSNALPAAARYVGFCDVYSVTEPSLFAAATIFAHCFGVAACGTALVLAGAAAAVVREDATPDAEAPVTASSAAEIVSSTARRRKVTCLSKGLSFLAECQTPVFLNQVQVWAL